MTNNTVIQFEGNDITGYEHDFGIDDIILTGTISPTYAWTTDAGNGNFPDGAQLIQNYGNC
ncbi:MAG: hypothetical protein CM15mP65_18050 [Crocinitomicaceae bacterium]|nr:MAG: hypothetical protein CM15mP65_18050 [Crocinitomicaceae bacterium]